MSEAKTPFQRVTDDLTGGCGCGCHTGIGYRTACDHCAAVPETKPEPTTLGEYIERRTGGDNTLLRRILYGTDKPCRVCKGRGSTVNYEDGVPTHRVPCDDCHGTGRDRTPGLVSRLRWALLSGTSTCNTADVERLLEAICREIGEV